MRTLATWIPATRQVLDDFNELRGYIDGALMYAVNKAEKVELVSVDATGEHLHGLIPQATTFNTALLTASAGWQRLDVIAQSVAQIAAAGEVEPSFVVENTADWWRLRLTKDRFGKYILRDRRARPEYRPSGASTSFPPTRSQPGHIVEDELLIAEDLRHTVLMLGYAVVGVTESGEQAVQQAVELRPDLVLLDYHLQGPMNGIEVGKLIQQAIAAAVVFVSANADVLA